MTDSSKTGGEDSRHLSDGLIGRIPLENVDDPLLCEGLAYWRSLRRGRKFPVRADITPRGLKSLMRNTMLIGVLDGGADYEYRVVGDAHVVAHGYSIQGRRWSELGRHDNVFAKQRKTQYDDAVRSGEPNAVSGFLARDFFAAEKSGRRDFVYCTAICLPLGRENTSVDYLLTFTVYSPGLGGEVSR